jgi:hypothetical protein
VPAVRRPQPKPFQYDAATAEEHNAGKERYGLEDRKPVTLVGKIIGTVVVAAFAASADAALPAAKITLTAQADLIASRYPLARLLSITDGISQGLAALRDFDPPNDCCGSWSSRALPVCPPQRTYSQRGL